MGTIFKIISEAISQAVQQLYASRLRTFLSLLGISIGIFCIIGVLSAVDSLEDNVRGSLAKIGSDVVYVKKWPWADVSGNWWEYMKRPNPDFADYSVLKEKSRTAELVSFHVVVGFRSLKFQEANAGNTVLIGASYEFDNMFKLEYHKGRYFSPAEDQYAAAKVILGFKVAEALFGTLEPIGRTVRLSGRDYEVVGVIAEAGKDLINPLDFDDAAIVPYSNARSLANMKARQIFDTSVTAKARAGVNIDDMKDELRGLLRAQRRLKPRQGDDFSLNELSMISSVFDSFFGVLNFLGIIIGFFAILVGGVSVANIMFVSVKERTSLIGIKKALGAMRYVILLEFLIESIILCLIGGFIGLGLVWLAALVLTQAVGFDFYLDMGNVVLGVFVSVLIGVVSGIVPAYQAARMDPVEAMRK